MKTEDFLKVLSADAAPRRQLAPVLLAVWSGAVLISGATYLATSGVRHDLASAIFAAPTIWKWLLPAILAGGGAALFCALLRPEGRAGRIAIVPLLALALAAVLIIGRLLVLPVDDWGRAARGQTLWICLASIVGIGLPALLATLLILRNGATSYPRLTGMAAGLACGSGAALLYGLHCTEDDPLFFVTWYGTAIILLALLGGGLGEKLLKW